MEPVTVLPQSRALSRRGGFTERDLKRARSQAAGCPAYWVVDPDEPSLTVWEARSREYVQTARVLGDQGYDAVTPYAVTVIPSRLLD